jgi:hypothetical protein
MKSFALCAALFAAPLLLGGCAPGSGSAAAPSIEEVFSAVDKYRDVNVALADGYYRNPLDTCETPSNFGLPAELGARGIPYLNRELLGTGPDHTRVDAQSTHTDFLRPAVLLYEPQGDGSLELVGVENVVNAAAWESAGNRRAPAFGRQGFHRVDEDAAQMIPAHYDLPIWLRDNPDGQHSLYNRAVTCRHHVIVMPMMHPDDTGRMVMPEPHPHIFGLPVTDENRPGQHAGH